MVNNLKNEIIKDEILDYLIVNKSNYFSASKLQSKLKEVHDIRYLELLLEEISDYKYDIVKVISKKPYAIQSIFKTEKFKSDGGFVQVKEKELLEHNKKRNKEQKELDSLEWNTKVSKYQVKMRWLPHIISILSLIISGIALWYSITNEK